MNCLDRLASRGDSLSAKLKRVQALKAEIAADLAELDAGLAELRAAPGPVCSDSSCACHDPPEERRRAIAP